MGTRVILLHEHGEHSLSIVNANLNVAILQMYDACSSVHPSLTILPATSKFSDRFPQADSQTTL